MARREHHHPFDHAWCLLCFIQSASVGTANIFRVALVSEFSGDKAGNSKNFIEGFKDFSAPVINSLGGVPIGGVRYQIEVIPYDTQSNATLVPVVIERAAKGLDTDGNAVGDVHAIVAGTSTMNKAIFQPAEAAGLVNIHTSGGNPTMWLEENTYAYGLHLPFIWYTRGPIRMAAAMGAKTIAIIRSMQHGFSRSSCIAALQWALDAELTIVGPSVAWCNTYGAQSGGCTVVGQRCVCGSQSDVNNFGLGYDIANIPNFYQLDEGLIGNGLIWHTVDAGTTDYVRGMFKDMLSQGSMPDIILNFATEWHNVLKAMILENVSPKVSLGWQGGTSVTWAAAMDNLGNQALTAIDGYWSIGFGQWHEAMRFEDPVFRTNANASSLFKAHRGRDLDYDTAGAIAAGVTLYTAMSRHFDKNFSTLSLAGQRAAVKQAVSDMNDETMWGTLRFNNRHQNIGRDTAAWQILPDANSRPEQLCVMPPAFAEALLVIPFPTWESRTGCSKGHYNSGKSCVPCPQGRANNRTTVGLETTNCSLCVAGTGAHLPGQSKCEVCVPGQKQDGDRDAGICRDCHRGFFQDAQGTTACIACPLGYFAEGVSQPNCQICSLGKYQGMSGDTECLQCGTGAYADVFGKSGCDLCPVGRFASEPGTTTCQLCPDGFTTENIASNSSSSCQSLCPQDTYRESIGQCVACKEGMRCPSGSDVANFGTNQPFPLVLPGFWSDPSGDKLSIFRCHDASRCIGGLPGSCAPRLVGRSCTKCEEHFFWDGQQCSKCSSVETSGLLYPVMPCVMAPFAIYILYRLFSDTLDKWGSHGNGIAVALYLTLNHYQVVAMIGDTTTISSTPKLVGSVLKIWKFLIDYSIILSGECAVSKGVKPMIIGQCLSPALFFLDACMVYFAVRCCSAVLGIQCLDPNRLFNVCMSVMFTLFTSIVAVSMALFKCLDNPNGERTLSADYSMICGSADWEALVIVAVLANLVYVVGFVSLLFYAICIAKQNIHRGEFQMRWKFLFIKFHFDACWFALLYLARAFLYNLGFVIFTRSLQQLHWLLSITILYVCALLKFLPYRHLVTTIVDGIVCISIMYICILKMWFSPREQDKMDNAVALAIVLINWSPLLVCLLVTAYYQIWYNCLDIHAQRTRRESKAFIRWVNWLAAADQDVLERVVTEVCELDRWHMIQTVDLFEGRRCLGMAGDRQSRESLFATKPDWGNEYELRSRSSKSSKKSIVSTTSKKSDVSRVEPVHADCIATPNHDAVRPATGLVTLQQALDKMSHSPTSPPLPALPPSEIQVTEFEVTLARQTPAGQSVQMNRVPLSIERDKLDDRMLFMPRKAAIPPHTSPRDLPDATIVEDNTLEML